MTLMEDDVRERIERTLADSPDTRLVAEGTFGMYSPDGQTSYRPPEGLADLLGSARGRRRRHYRRRHHGGAATCWRRTTAP